MTKLKFSREVMGQNVLEVVSEGIEAETLGFDFVWIPDHLVDIEPASSIFDAWTVLSYLGAKTGKIILASGVTDTQRIHPAKTANIVATLDNLSQGRTLLGIGAGEIMNTRPFGINWEEKKIRVRRLREYITVVRLLWNSSYGHPANFNGEFYSLKEAYFNCLPLQKPSPPVYVGAFSSRALLELIGEIADGWYPASYHTLSEFSKKIQIIKEAAAKNDRSSKSIDIMANIPTVVCNDDESLRKVKDVLKVALKRELLTSQYLQKYLGVKKDEIASSSRDLEYQLATPGPRYDRALEQAVQRVSVSDEILESAIADMMAIGSVDDCISSIERFVKAGATHIFFSSLGGSRDNFTRISKEIIPRLETMSL